MKLELAMQRGFNFAKKNRLHGKKKFAIFSSRSFTDFFFREKKFQFRRIFFLLFFQVGLSAILFSRFFFRENKFRIRRIFLLFFQVALSAIFFPVENSFIRSLD